MKECRSGEKISVGTQVVCLHKAPSAAERKSIIDRGSKPCETYDGKLYGISPDAPDCPEVKRYTRGTICPAGSILVSGLCKKETEPEVKKKTCKYNEIPNENGCCLNLKYCELAEPCLKGQECREGFCYSADGKKIINMKNQMNVYQSASQITQTSESRPKKLHLAEGFCSTGKSLDILCPNFAYNAANLSQAVPLHPSKQPQSKPCPAGKVRLGSTGNCVSTLDKSDNMIGS
ncbi:MAG: hypothetical protein MHPSP_000511 [Paramarteilia canceri]